MKGAAYTEPGKIEVIEVDMLEAGPSELLVRTRDCGICGSDLHAVIFGGDERLGPVMTLTPNSIMGHEFCGEVAALGEGVTGFAPGDLVVSVPISMCNECEACASGNLMLCQNMKAIGLGGLPGGYGEYMRLSAQLALKVPEGTSARKAALTEPLAVGLHAVNNAHLQPEDRVVITGAGPIGLVTLLWAKLAVPASVIVSEPSPGRREQAKMLGADEVIDPTVESPLDASMRLYGAPPSVVFECVGVPGLIQQALDTVGPMGRILVVGVCMDLDSFMPVTGILKQVTLSFQLGYTPEEFADALAAIASGKVDPEPLITDIISMDEVPAMFAALAKPSTQIKVLVEFP
jgi:(R,R)-butanediol dehydrogenase/meso-butanediol dehydrogenase/diacetyl reductase